MSSPLRQGGWLHLTNRLHSLTTMLPHGLLDDRQDLGFDVLGQTVPRRVYRRFGQIPG
jgi:hypothetical protein